MHNAVKEYRVALVTGATGAIGKAIALGIADQPGYRVVLLCRDAHKAEKTVSEIVALTGNEQVGFEIVDVSGRDSIESLAQRLRHPVHVLVNNAAATPAIRGMSIPT